MNLTGRLGNGKLKIIDGMDRSSPAFGGDKKCLRAWAKANFPLAYMGLRGWFARGADCCFLVEDLRFTFSFSKTGSFAGWFGAPVSDLGFLADGVITRCEPLDVPLQLIRFGSFLCHAHSLTRNRCLCAWLSTEMRRLGRFLPPKQEKD
jgi:hypothetical protein